MPQHTTLDLARRLEAYLCRQMPEARSLHVERLMRIVGGASRETWSFDAVWQEQDTERRRGFILRRDPDAGLLESDRTLEYRAYRAFANSEVPVPAVYWLESDPAPLGRPFFIMERIDGCRTDGNFLGARPEDERTLRLARRKFAILGALHRADPRAVGLADIDPLGLPSPAEAAARQLDHWERIVAAQAQEPLPVVRLAVAWLRAHPPPPAQRIVVCHGDFRSGNFLYDYEAGEIRGVLDWEMVHLGDPLEDLAWTCLVNWRYGGGGAAGGGSSRIGGLVERETALRLYEAASGVHTDEKALHWWDVFSHVKAIGIWITGGRSFADGRTSQPFMALIPRLLNGVQEEAILDLLGW